MSNELQVRIEELEVRVAFQDDLLATLNASVAGLDRGLGEARAQIERLRQSLDAMRVALAHDAAREPPPPHY
jgi:SlyX protein